jgi:DNA helicase-2/ATP-dependent DNA helicase PcrA
VAEALEKRDIPFVIESDENILQDADLKKLVMIFKAIEHFGEDPYVGPVLHIDFLHVAPCDAYELISYAADCSIPLWKVLRVPLTYEKNDFENPESLKKLSSLLSSWRTLSKNVTLPEFFGKVLRESGLLGLLLSGPDCISKMDKVTGLFEEIKSFSVRRKNASLGDFLAYLAMLEEQDILIAKKESYKRPGSVRLMTAHRSKGLEFDYVYIVKAHDGHWSNRRTIEHIKLPEKVLGILQKGNIAQRMGEDDRRLFYVALTRARKGVTISYAYHAHDGKEQMVTQFVEEIQSGWKEMRNTSDFELGFMKNKEILFAPKKIMGPSIKDKEFIRQLFEKRGLSVTGLNNYLICPWRYFYVNLLRIPQIPSKHQLFGIATHEALRRFFDVRNKEGSATKEFLLSAFEEELKKQPLTSHDADASISKGKRALDGYYEKWKQTWGNQATRNEFHVKVLFPAGSQFELTEQKNIQLQGKLDRVDIINERGEVVVTDYKTGRPKTRNYIEGLTKDSQGEYLRQLVFYKLLLSLYFEGRMAMVLGRIDFVEPDKSGKYVREEFIISDASVTELEEMVRQVAWGIFDVSFWDRRCNDPECDFCALREMTV